MDSLQWALSPTFRGQAGRARTSESQLGEAMAAQAPGFELVSFSTYAHTCFSPQQRFL